MPSGHGPVARLDGSPEFCNASAGRAAANARPWSAAVEGGGFLHRRAGVSIRGFPATLLRLGRIERGIDRGDLRAGGFAPRGELLHGRLYLLPGTKEDVVNAFRRDFPTAR